MFDVVSDKTWKVADTPAFGWTNIEFDDSAWEAAKEIADVEGGYWAEKLRTDYQNQEYQLRVADGGHPATAGLSGIIGRAVVLDGVEPGADCKMVVMADQIPIGIAGEGPAGKLVLLS